MSVSSYFFTGMLQVTADDRACMDIVDELSKHVETTSKCVPQWLFCVCSGQYSWGDDAGVWLS